jgi:uncharacterized membrane protein
MLICSECGTPLPPKASFCPNCGVAFEPRAADEPKAAATVVLEEAQAGSDGPVVASRVERPIEPLPGVPLPMPENIAGVLAYLTVIPSIAFLFLEPFRRNHFVRFHAWQHVLVWIAGFLCMIAATILGGILQWIPFMRVLVFPLLGLITLAWFFVWLLLVVKAYQHEMFKLPIIGELAEEWAERGGSQ